ncbi:MAG: hypothetical protein FVQ78_06490 [Solirubrobacterales bacterium]|nr:hypothetical protein [Solirubrobacterales bacterium]
MATVAAFALVPASSALAVDDSSTLEVTAGSLSFDYSGEIGDFAGITLTGGQLADQNLNTPTAYEVTDGRGTGVGWAVQAAGRTLANAVSPELRLFCSGVTVAPCNEVGVEASTYYDQTVTASTLRADSTALTTGSLEWDSTTNNQVIAATNESEGGTNLPTDEADVEAVTLGGDTTARTLVNAVNDKGMGTFSITPGTNNIQGTFPSTTLATSTNAETHYQVDLVVTLKNTGD